MLEERLRLLRIEKYGAAAIRQMLLLHCRRLAVDVCPWYTAANMPQFVIEREIPGAGSLSDTQLRDISLRSLETLEGMGPQIQWLHSYVTEDKVYCVYLAPDENSIREHARLAGVPADRVSAVRRMIDPVNLR